LYFSYLILFYFSFDEIKEKKLLNFENRRTRENFMNNLRNENSNIILKEKVNDKTKTCSNVINDLKNENFIKENKMIITNHFNETKKNFRNTLTTDNPSTMYSSKGFYSGSSELKKSLIGFCKKKFPDGNK
jgi:DNA-directed RNA polymerase specialized sigma subunit